MPIGRVRKEEIGAVDDVLLRCVVYSVGPRIARKELKAMGQALSYSNVQSVEFGLPNRFRRENIAKTRVHASVAKYRPSIRKLEARGDQVDVPTDRDMIAARKEVRDRQRGIVC